jgi:hypothetical protein
LPPDHYKFISIVGAKMLHACPQHNKEASSNDVTGEESPIEIAPGASMEAVLAISIGQHSGKLAEMARNAGFHSLADLLASAQNEAKLWARACEDR